ncbi:hypothetical protein ACH5RR_011240 [Cinchona calisaya]|uniref:Uncharacterized protein n=1 Tax=Cinchona calisaya TaxID=153742 RepID=A0ABD3A4E5_9GENT
MCSRPKSFMGIPTATRRSRRRPNSDRRVCRKPLRGSSGCSHAVSNKLEALKNLIPLHDDNHGREMKTDQLFQETADYIVLLQTQISVLQKLVDFYGSGSSTCTAGQPQENQNAV